VLAAEARAAAARVEARAEVRVAATGSDWRAVVGLVAVARVVVAEEEPVGRISEWRVGVVGAATWAVSAACPAGAARAPTA